MAHIFPMLESIIDMRQAKVQLMDGCSTREEILGWEDGPTKHSDSGVTFLTAGLRSWLQDMNPSLQIPSIIGHGTVVIEADCIFILRFIALCGIVFCRCQIFFPIHYLINPAVRNNGRLSFLKKCVI